MVFTNKDCFIGGIIVGALAVIAFAYVQVYWFGNGVKYKCPKCGEITDTSHMNKKVEYYEKAIEK